MKCQTNYVNINNNTKARYMRALFILNSFITSIILLVIGYIFHHMLVIFLYPFIVIIYINISYCIVMILLSFSYTIIRDQLYYYVYIVIVLYLYCYHLLQLQLDNLHLDPLLLVISLLLDSGLLLAISLLICVYKCSLRVHMFTIYLVIDN